MKTYPSLRRARKSKRWTVYRLAKEASVSRSYIKALENGKADNPGLNTLGRVFKALEVGEVRMIYVNFRYRLNLTRMPELFRSEQPQKKR